jgi:hypothetical protein
MKGFDDESAWPNRGRVLTPFVTPTLDRKMCSMQNNSNMLTER